MLKKTQIFIILVLLAFASSLFFLQPAPTTNNLKPILLLQPAIAIPVDSNLVKLVNAVNRKCQQTKTFECRQVHIKLHGRFFNKATAECYYEKDLNFRLKVKSLLSKEMDIGSNKDIFWFWSKRMDPPYLNYATHDRLHFTGLKTPFNPIWLKSILGFDSIDYDLSKCSVCLRGEHTELSFSETNPAGKQITRIILIDQANERVVGNYLVENGNIVAFAEIKSFINQNGIDLPSEILFSWTEENIYMTWSMERPLVNTVINNTEWQMPTGIEKVDIGYLPNRR